MSTRIFKVSALIICVVITIMGLSSCGPASEGKVLITYRQSGNFNHWKMLYTDGSVYTEGRINDGMYVRFQITSIQNTDKNAKRFHFDPAKIYVSDNTQKVVTRIGDPKPLPFVDTGAFWVEANQTYTGKAAFTIKMIGDPNTLKNVVPLLSYDMASGELVTFIRDQNNSPNPPIYFDPLTKDPN